MLAKTPLSVTESPRTVPEGGQSGGGTEEYLVGSVTPSTASGPSSKPTVVEFQARYRRIQRTTTTKSST